MLGAGFFTAQKGKQSVDVGVKQASSSLELDGQYIYLKANKTGSDGDVGKIYFYVTLSAGGTPIDLEQTVLALRYKDYYMQLPYGGVFEVGINTTLSKINFTSISINKTKLDNATSDYDSVGNASIIVNLTVENKDGTTDTIYVTATDAVVYGMNVSSDDDISNSILRFDGYIKTDVTGNINGVPITGKFYLNLSGTIDKNANELNITTLANGELKNIVATKDDDKLGISAYYLGNSLVGSNLTWTCSGGGGDWCNNTTADKVNFSTGAVKYVPWWYTGIVYIDTSEYDNLLEKNEKYEIVINTLGIKKGKGLSDLPETNDYLTIELKPSIGSPLIINKQVPPSLSKLTWV